jgi:hypothetical protein
MIVGASIFVIVVGAVAGAAAVWFTQRGGIAGALKGKKGKLTNILMGAGIGALVAIVLTFLRTVI